jgi:hypothetical protein
VRLASCARWKPPTDCAASREQPLRSSAAKAWLEAAVTEIYRTGLASMVQLRAGQATTEVLGCGGVRVGSMRDGAARVEDTVEDMSMLKRAERAGRAGGVSRRPLVGATGVWLGAGLLLAAALTAGCGARAADGRGSYGSGGAEPAPALNGTPPTRLDDTLDVLLADLSAQPAADQPFLRYLVQTPFDNPELPGEQTEREPPRRGEESLAQQQLSLLNRNRVAVSKIANSLSTAPALALPVAVDEARLIQRIDLRDYVWDRTIDVDGRRYADGWEAIRANAALAVEFTGPAADALKELAGTPVPFLFAHDFVATAVDGELYYGLLGVPAQLEALQNSLNTGVLNLATDAANDTTAYRAGFTRSGISTSPRVVERRVSDADATRGYWLAFDFADERRGRRVFSEPLTFAADATEVMYELPNGLRGFFLASPAGERVAASSVSGVNAAVQDPARLDSTLRTAGSCFSCHAWGPITFQDQVRDIFEQPALPVAAELQRERVLSAYPGDSVIEPLIEQDYRSYAAALLQLGQDEQSEPITTVDRQFRGLELSRSLAAGELFVTPEFLEGNLTLLPPELGVFDASTGELSRGPLLAVYRVALCVLQSASRNQPSDCP